MNRDYWPMPARFWLNVEPGVSDHECWIWTGTSGKYGRFSLNGSGFAHRVAYELEIGPIPEGMTIDHLCRNRLCVNPAHLEPVTNRENLLRGNGVSGRNARKTHCIRGHEFTPQNTRIDRSPTKTERVCRACLRLHWTAARSNARARAALALPEGERE